MRETPSQKTSSFAGYLIFFLTVTVVVTLSIMAFVAVNRATEGDVVAISVTVFIIIIAISAACTLIDVFRRRLMIDKPVKEILDATNRIAEGDFSVRLEVDSPYDKCDDYDLIKENLNAMSEELEKNAVLKNDFVSNISHELKTPLAVIKTYVTALESESDPELRRSYTETVRRAIDRLSDLVTNILKLTKLENETLGVEYSTFSIEEVLAEALLGFEEKIEEKGLDIDFEVEDGNVHSVRGYLDIIFTNIISNALKFTEPSGKVTVRGRLRSGNAIVEISDTGIGIDKRSGARIFEKFYQADASHAAEGNGLGLALVKRAIDILGGDVSVSSELGVGTKFTVTLRGVAE